MAQADLVVSNQSGAAVRADLNAQLLALGTKQSGNSPPSVTYPYMDWADTAAGLWKQRNAANDGWVTIGILGTANLGLAPLASPIFTGTPAAPTATAGTNTTQLATTAFVLANNVPAGAVDYFAMSAAPTGYLKANGAAISRTTYATLFSAIGTLYGAGDGSTTFNVPDLRGEFTRAWADGRAVDTGRTFASFQDQAYLSHSHGVTDPTHAHAIHDPGHAHSLNSHTPLSQADNDRGTGSSDFSMDNFAIPVTLGAATGIGIYGAATGVSIQNSGGAETRPRNIALLACIKF